MRKLLVLVIVLLLCGGPARAAAAEDEKLNVLFIAVDDLRPELGCYGDTRVKSPHLDAFAKSALQFNRAYCQLALCNPSRASLLSGRRPETLGIYDLATFVRDAADDVVTLPQLFKENGYQSVRFGKIFHTTNGNRDDPISWSAAAPDPKEPADAPDQTDKSAAAAKEKKARAQKQAAAAKTKAADAHADELPWGDPDVPDEKLRDGQIANNAIAALRRMKDQPFFLAVGFHKPHLPFIAPKKYWDLYDRDRIELPPNREHPKDAPAFVTNDSSELRRYKGVPKEGPAASDDEARRLIHAYLACVSFVDAQIGKVLAELDALGLREKTVVIIWGDHGYHLGEQGTWNKRTNWEIATRVPMLIRAPGQEAVGQQTDALVEFVDIYPTLVELCGLPLPPKLEGTSFVRLMHDPTQPWKTAAFSIYQKRTDELGNTFGRAMRTERYRFIEWSAPGKDQKFYELYDHQTDPQETTNVAVLPENKDLVAKLSRQLQAGWENARPQTAQR